MPSIRLLAAASVLFYSTFAAAQLPPGVTMEMVNTQLPEEGAPKAVPGPYPVTSSMAAGAEGLKVFHPRELGHFPDHDTLPVVVWGNGGCAIDNPRYAGMLETIASHGFLVITTAASGGAAAPPAAAPAGNAPAAAPRRQATAADLAAGITWAEQENQRRGSPLAGKIAVQQVAVMGQSCGGRLSIELGADPRVDTIGVFNAGLQPAQMELLAKLHGPVLLINGHERDFMYGPSRATFDALKTLPAFYGARRGAGHTATAYHAGGGEYANVAANWVRWQFKKSAQAAKMFTGPQCALCTDANWETAANALLR